MFDIVPTEFVVFFLNFDLVEEQQPGTPALLGAPPQLPTLSTA
jgi:hypothetical protein